MKKLSGAQQHYTLYNLIISTKRRSMSWYWEMKDGERRCMDFGEYVKYGWVEDKTFTVEDYELLIERNYSTSSEPS